jgi:uncharacterized protein YgiM (DUF1202 family)
MKFLAGVALLAVFFVSTGLYSEELQSIQSEKISVPADVQKFPFLGRIKGKNINVRGGNNLNFEILTQLQDQETVIVMGESLGWYQIDPPPTAFLWINRTYVKDGVLTADAVNVRCSPTLAGTLNCQLAKNDSVEVVAEEGEWLKIKPPAQAKAWVSTDYVTYEKPLDEGLEILKSEKAKALQESRKKKMLEAAQVYEEAEFYKPVEEIQVDGILSNYQNLLKEFPNDESLKTEIEGRMAAVKSKAEKLHSIESPAPYVENGPLTLAQSDRSSLSSPASVLHEDVQNIKAETPQVSSGTTEQTTDEATKDVSSPQVANTQSEFDDSRLQVFQGKLEWAGGFGRGKKYKLVENRKRVCILMQKDFSLQPFVHQKVKVYGKTVSWVYPRVPVVRVVKVERA